MKPHLTLVCFLLFFVSISSYSQAIQRIADINPGPSGSFFDEYGWPIEYDGKLLFTAFSAANGDELWIYDGTSTSLVKDIYPGPISSAPQNFYLMNDKVIFNATDSLHGTEWWITDGTPGGTELLVDIYPGPSNGAFVQIAPDRRYHHIYNGEVYFSGAHRENDYELWKTDGTAAGTLLIKNIKQDGMSFNSPSYPRFYAEHQGLLYFSSTDGLWKTDGTPDGTVLVRRDDPDDVFNIDPYDMISNGDYLLFLHDLDLWRSDGTIDGTIKIKDLESVTLNWFGHRFTRIGNIVLFPSDDGVHGDELWRSDGTTAGTYMVVDLIEGSNGYAPQNNLFFNNMMYYVGDNGTLGHELWRTDGTEAGTQLVKDIDPGSDDGFFGNKVIITDGELIYMRAGDAFDKELWVSDGTTNGTFEIDIDPNGGSGPYTLAMYGEKVFAFADTENFGYEPHIIDALAVSNEEISSVSQVITYPNPTNGMLHIEIPEGTTMKHTLLDLKGNIILDGITTTSIDVSGIPAGTYLLSSRDEKKGIIYLDKVVLVK